MGRSGGVRTLAGGAWAAVRRSTAGPVYIALIVVFVVSWIAVAIDGGSFFTVDNVVDMLVRSVALGIVAAGQTLVILGGSLDLSVAYVISLASIVGAETMAGEESRIALGIGAVLLLGAGIGLVNGLVITKLRVNAFIATLGTALIIRGIIESRWDGPTGAVPDSFESLGYTRFGPIPESVILLAAVVAVVWFLLRFTSFGHRLYAVGGNEEVSKLSGVRTHRVLIGAHMLCAMAAALTGLFLASRLGAGSPLVGSDGGYDLESIAAVVLGGTYLLGGRGGVLGTLAGVFILAVLDNAFNQLEVNAFAKDVVRGVIIIAAVAAYSVRWRSRRARRQVGTPPPGGREGTPAVEGAVVP
ncbi:MAG: ABC transporter permease [Solirubrobacterales bacterium]|nr:ABC transporter permease [Solirubrobacterales bacterium]